MPPAESGVAPKPPPRRRSLLPRWQARLHWRLLVAIGIPLLLIDGLRMYVGYQDDRREAERQAEMFLGEVTRHQAETLAAGLAPIMQATRSAGWFIASGKLGYGREAMFETAIGVLDQSPDIYGSALAFEPSSGHGAIYVRRSDSGPERIDYAKRGVDYSSQDWFRESLENDEPYWSEPYFDPAIGGIWTVTYVVPITATDGSRAVITADLASASQHIQWHSLWAGESRVVDADGHYLAWSSPVKPAINGLLAAAARFQIEGLDEIVRAIRNEEPGFARLRNPNSGEGQAWLSWAPIAGSDWSLLAILDENRVLANARQQLLHQLMISATALLAILLILLTGTRRLTRPLQALRRVARAVRHGDRSKRVGPLRSRDEIAEFASAFDGMLDALDASQAERLREAERRQRIEGELSAAREIQRRLLPPPWADWSRRAGPTPGFEFRGLCEPATLMSGDFYDAFRLDADTIALVVADVCGKGTSAALYMSIVHTHLRDFVRPENSPAEALRAVNRALVDAGHQGMFVTLVLAYYRLGQARLDYVCAGHPPPLLARADGGIEIITANGGLVGAFDDVEFSDGEVQLEPGDTLLCYTDGVTEAGQSSRGLYGTERLQALLAAAVHEPLEQLDQSLRDAVLAFCGGQAEDDITLLAIRRTA